MPSPRTGVGIGAPLAGEAASLWGYAAVFYVAAAFAAGRTGVGSGQPSSAPDGAPA